MTTPPRALTALGVLGTLGVGAVLLMGAVAVPAPEASWAAVIQAATVVDAMQGTDGLPPLRITQDPRRQLMGFISPSGSIGTREVAPAGRWFPTSVDGRTGFVPAALSPNFPFGQVSPPDPDARIQQLASIPRILNPDEISQAIDEAYPQRLRERGVGGTVGVLFLVERTGVVHDRRIGQVSAYADLDAAALEVARVYRFSGAATDEGAVPVWVSHAIDFRVE